MTHKHLDEALAVLEHIRADAPLLYSSLHGEQHWQAVATIALRLAKQNRGGHPRLTLLFAILHDSRRETDHFDPDHGYRAAELADTPRAEGLITLTEDDHARLIEALSRHDDGDTTFDPGIGACWDADRLCLPRIGIQPRTDLLSTHAGRTQRTLAKTVLHHPLRDWRACLTGELRGLHVGRSGVQP